MPTIATPELTLIPTLPAPLDPSLSPAEATALEAVSVAIVVLPLAPSPAFERPGIETAGVAVWSPPADPVGVPAEILAASGLMALLEPSGRGQGFPSHS
jgi:hypothetical protein